MRRAEPRNRIRDMVAAHELGHALVWRALGIQVVRITVRGEDRVRGWTELDGGTITSREEMRAYLIGVLAGGVAGGRWCDEYHIRRAAQDCEFDQINYRRQRRDPLAHALRNGELRRAAQVAVARRWAEIERLAPRLAQRGTLRP